MYAVTTHCRSAASNPRSRPMAGSAIATMVTSRTTTNCATQRSARACVTPFHLFGGNQPSLRVNSVSVVTRSIETIEFWGGDLALDFANTTEGPGKDHLCSYADLVTWARRAGVLPQTVRPRGDLDRALELRAAIYDAFTTGEVAEDAARRSTPRRSRRARSSTAGSRGPGRHPDRPLWPIAVAAVDLLRSDRLVRGEAVRQLPRGCSSTAAATGHAAGARWTSAACT